MKKLILLIILISNLLLCNAQKKFTATSNIEGGYENRMMSMYFSDEIGKPIPINPLQQSLRPYYAVLDFNAYYQGFNIGASNKTYFNKSEQIYYNPLQIEFRLHALYNYHMITFGYEHMCSHGIEYKWFAESYDKIYLKIKLF